jgi:hypothetical protein
MVETVAMVEEVTETMEEVTETMEAAMTAEEEILAVETSNYPEAWMVDFAVSWLVLSIPQCQKFLTRAPQHSSTCAKISNLKVIVIGYPFKAQSASS